MVSFVKGVNDGECDLFAYLEDPSLATVATVHEAKNVDDVASYCGNGYCTWQQIA